MVHKIFCCFPDLLIQDMVNNNFMEKFELGYVIFCAVATTISILTMWFLARIFMKDKSIIGEFVQASYRSSAAVLGAAFILNIYSDTGMVPLMIIGAVPLYNIFAVIILTVECPYIQSILQLEEILKPSQQASLQLL